MWTLRLSSVGSSSLLALAMLFLSLPSMTFAWQTGITFKTTRTLSFPLKPLKYINDSNRPDVRVLPHQLQQRRQEWLDRSIMYYSKVMREERRKQLGQVDSLLSGQSKPEEYEDLAQKHYFALRKIKDGQWNHAESIYRRILNELMDETEHEACDHAQLAVTTLLLALLTQRMNDPKKTRAVFLQFFRLVVMQEENKECACSAKVLQAFALFEMKQGNARKSLEIVHKAIQLDPSLHPVLNWKQFRDVSRREKSLKP
jgi:tetratricopeptide (TPR) repeat protein